MILDAVRKNMQQAQTSETLFKEFENRVEALLKEYNSPKKDTHFIIVVKLCNDFNIAVVDTLDKTLGYITYDEFGMLIGRENFDICYYNEAGVKGTALFYTGEELGVTNVNDKINFYVATDKIYSISSGIFTPVYTDGTDYYSSDSVWSGRRLFSCEVSNVDFEDYLIPVLCAFYTYAYRKPCMERNVDADKLNLPVTEVIHDLFRGFGGVETYDFLELEDTYIDNEGAVDTFLSCGRNPNWDNSLGYDNVISGLNDVLRAKNAGKKYCEYEHVTIDNDHVIYTQYRRMKVSAVFCKRFAREYLSALSSCVNKLARKRIIEELDEVYTELKKLSK